MSEIVLVCGGRDFADSELLNWAMSQLPPHQLVIHGGARGADTRAGEYAKAHKTHEVVVPALWDCFGNSAGPKRNQAMLLLKPTLCLAFPGGAGTRDMVSRCESINLPVWLASRSVGRRFTITKTIGGLPFSYL